MANTISIQKIMSYSKALVPLTANIVSSFFGLKNKLDPFYISWILTYRCNRRCKHCDWVWNKTSKDHLKLELSDNERLSIADQIAHSWIWGITLSGGEPLLDPALFKIIEKLTLHKKYVNLCTNGVLLSQYAATLIRLSVSTITVSFDSHKSCFHDDIRGVKGTFDNALEGLKTVCKLRGNKKSPKLVVKGVLFPSNLDDIEDYVSFFKNYADTIAFQPVQNNYGHQVHDTSCLFTPDDEPLFVKTISNLAKIWPEFNHPYYQDMSEYLFHPQNYILKHNYRCIFSSSMYLGIDPYGNTGGCLERFTSGNLKSQTIREVWQSNQCCSDQKAMRVNPRPCICWNYGHILDSYLLPAYNFFHPER